MQKTRKTYYANGTDIGDAMIRRGIYYLNGAEATTQDWTGKPSDWSDIRKDCPANSIALYAGHTADYSQYDNLGFTATCTGGYKVFIDGTQYGSTYASGSTCTITWSTSGIATGDIITTPSLLKAHKIWIEPATSGNNITRFASARVSTGSEQEFQGKLWIHFNLSNTIQVSNLLRASGTFSANGICKAITAKNNTLKCAVNISSMCQNCTSLEYLPVLVSSGEAGNGVGAFNGCEILKSITLKNFKFTSINYGFNNCYFLEKIKHSNTEILNTSSGSTINSQYNECRKLQNLLPETYTANITRAQNYIHNTPELKDTVIDLRGATALTELGIFSYSTYFAKGIKGVRVSNQAPFDRNTPPQINVSYTGMDRNALVQLFEDLPYNVGYEVVGSPTISSGVVSGFSNDDYLESASNPPSEINSLEINIDFKVPETFGANFLLAYNTSFQGGTNLQAGVSMASNGVPRAFLFRKSDNTFATYSITGYDLRQHTGERFIANFKTDKSTVWCKLYDSFNTLVASNEYTEQDLAGSINSKVRIGRGISNSSYFYNYYVYLNNTYIKVNDVYWFRGQPAMTKTLSCVGATGTADLTADDKDIALNKGWSLTLS